MVVIIIWKNIVGGLIGGEVGGIMGFFCYCGGIVGDGWDFFMVNFFV